MKVDRCRRIELILDDAYILASLDDDYFVESARCRMIKKRISGLTEYDRQSLMKLIVDMEHNPKDLYHGTTTNRQVVAILKQLALSNQDNISVYNRVNRQYERQLRKLNSHSLINRSIKVNHAFKMMKPLAKLYPDSEKTVQNVLKNNSSNAFSHKYFCDEVVDLIRYLDCFNETELKMLKKKCISYDKIERDNKHTNMNLLLSTVLENKNELSNTRNIIRETQKPNLFIQK